ncbi:hypothetical protein [Edaphobacter aggregans]|uniref:hypothetical protein n=1 Tax=Edaphobacter aggregans TaxID=570835 RepID=UPI000552DD68|nr:hypothetical protein [Edaphobacter aggregans]
MGWVTMPYDVPSKKYLMVTTDSGTTGSKFNIYILESSSLTGPWKLVVYMRSFGEQGYFANSKFISQDGRTVWLSYSANIQTITSPIRWANGYWRCLQGVHLLGRQKVRSERAR